MKPGAATSLGQTRPQYYDLRMLDKADQLFNEYDSLPVRDVLDAVIAARSQLRLDGELVPDVELVGTMARQLLDGPSARGDADDPHDERTCP